MGNLTSGYFPVYLINTIVKHGADLCGNEKVCDFVIYLCCLDKTRSGTDNTGKIRHHLVSLNTAFPLNQQKKVKWDITKVFNMES